ncbi:hypothetical protein PSV08DRAFT_247580 [Bipolaris maydis]|uniref:uncharacterized protein n=1 Tax=Cochliobolus heterostrophus TaxID=5016 RepID=UPI0024D9B625|nr:hypothetical protein J3E73DRAFT_256419 [Bipolaris maydis]KAJ6270899.1 hypothetical protein PSV08DRAFT_247580 [Bipolaris maydis]KAJ6278251.1 hypothetical protein J3E71DRAFT_244333 [Bipolaris maydis]
MQFTSILIGLLSTLPSTLSAPASSVAHNDDPQMCGYVLTVQNSSAYAGISAYSSCTPIYYNQSIPGYQAAFAYSIFGGCRCKFHGSEQDCVSGQDAPVYEGPIGEVGKEPHFGEPKPKWYNYKNTGSWLSIAAAFGNKATICATLATSWVSWIWEPVRMNPGSVDSFNGEDPVHGSGGEEDEEMEEPHLRVVTGYAMGEQMRSKSKWLNDPNVMGKE